MIPFAETIDGAKKYVVSSTLGQVDWNAELLQGDLEDAVRQLKEEPGDGLAVAGLTLPLALADLRLIDEYEFLVQPILAGHGPTLFAGLARAARPAARGPPRAPIRRSGPALRAPPRDLTGWCRRGDLNPHVLSDTGT